jgi:hypothetical protein
MARVSQDELALIEEDKIRQKQLYGIEPAPEIPRGDFIAIKQLEKTQAQLGEFMDPEQIKLNVRAQAKMIKENGSRHEFDRIQKGVPKGELIKILGDDAYDGKSINGEQMLADKYSKHIDKEAYDEFWQDISQIRAPGSRGAMGHRRGSVMTPSGGRMGPGTPGRLPAI